MHQYINSKDGVTFLDVMVGIVALLGFTSMMVTTTNFMAKNQQQIREETQFNQVVHNTVSETYTIPHWNNLQDEEVTIDDGVVQVNYRNIGTRDNYSTQVLNVSFHLGDREEVYQLERSVLREN